MDYTWTHKKKRPVFSEVELGGSDNHHYHHCQHHCQNSFLLLLLLIWYLTYDLFLSFNVSNICFFNFIGNKWWATFICILSMCVEKSITNVWNCQNQVNKCALIICICNKRNTWTETQCSKLSHPPWGCMNKTGLTKPHHAVSGIKTTRLLATPHSLECRQSGFRGCVTAIKLKWCKPLH